MPELAHWDSFYVIVGTAAGALIGLMFVVMTLIAEKPPRGAAGAGSAFATPTIVHFSVVLLVSALIRAPWHAATSIAALCAIIGFGGVVYALLVARRMSAQIAYKPEREDWICYALIPLVGYALIGTAGLTLPSSEREGLFAIAAGVLVLLFIGIRNAWDAVSYHVLVSLANRDER
jgi:uncharacterized protein YacL